MSEKYTIPQPVISTDVTTACGTPEKFSPETPRAVYEGRWIFFCTSSCQQEFVQDPQNSCLTIHSIDEPE